MLEVLKERATALEKDQSRMAALEAHLRQWQDIGERIRAQLAPILTVRESVHKAIQPIVEAQKTFQAALEPIVAQQEYWRQMLQSIQLPKVDLSEISRLAEQAANFQRSIQQSLGPVFEQLQKSFRELPPRTQEAILLLGAHGWYLDLEMSLPELWELKTALSQGNVQEAEAELVAYFEDRSKEIEESIVHNFPHRAHLIRAAFNAHRRQEYELSIPVLLSQTDGICKEVIGQYLFMRANKKPRTAIYVEQIAADTYTAALLSPLAQVLPIGASEHERPEGFSALNRHLVMHGESLDYGSYTNSLKSISLINYVAHVLGPEKENP